ncbi:MAG: hypothetical protein IT308_08775 [Anaerolineaceae bacterium]|nr:hypothetical protein [Anaerolineaceae bacterium]
MPPDYFRETLDNVPKNTLALKDLVDEFHLYNNESDYTLIYEKIDQKENILKDSYWKEYNRIYGTEQQEKGLGSEQLLPGSVELGSVESGLAGGLVEGGYVHRAGPGHYGGGAVPAGSEEPRAVVLPLGEIEKHYPMPTTEAEAEAYSSIVEPVLNNLEGRLQSVEMQRPGPLEERIRSGLKENYPNLTDEEINLRTHELMRNVRGWLGDVKRKQTDAKLGYSHSIRLEDTERARWWRWPGRFPHARGGVPIFRDR